MFKVQENGDGSTSIFCNKTGSLICTIRSQQKNMGLGCRPVNVVEPSPKPRSDCFGHDLKTECLSDEDDKLDKSKNDFPEWDEPKEDFSDDCITPEEFARCLNLVPTEKFKTEPIEQLRTYFPLRHLSRTKSFPVTEDLRDMKFPDDTPLTSSLGVRLLKLNSQKNFYSDQTIAMKIKHYDSFCRFQLNTPTNCNFPKLRCREKKEYPVSIPSKMLKYGPCHTYAFNRRQRLEKMITFKTGLNARSRRLLQQCNKRLVISVKKLTSEEIHNWLPKTPGVIRPITMDTIISEEPCSLQSDSDATEIEEIFFPYSSSSESSNMDSTTSSDSDYLPYLPDKIVSFKGVLTKSEKCLTPIARNKNGQFAKAVKSSLKYKDCYIKLTNVIKGVYRSFDEYYVTGTNIRIPFLLEDLKSIDPNLTSFSSDNNFVSNSRYDHAYHRPFSQEVSRKKLSENSHCLNNHKSAKAKSSIKEPLKVSNCVKNKSNLPTKLNNIKNSNSLKNSHVNNLKMSKSKNIPVIDLTNDSSPNSPLKEGKYVPKKSKWTFTCYGCGYKRTFSQESSANISAAEHMKNFHKVSNPEPFLHLNHTASCAMLEAFPGYKGSECC